MNLVRLGIALTIMQMLPVLVTAAPSPRPLPAPDHDFLTAGTVHALARDASGRTLLAGEFEAIGNVPRSNLARFLPNGSLDLTFQCDVDGPVHDVVAASGDILIGGAFTHVNGVPRAGLARVDTNCAVDAFGSQMPPGTVVSAIVHEPNGGHVWVGGTFSAPRQSLAMFHPSGELAEPSFAFDGPIRTMESDGAGGVFVAGGFTQVDGNLQHGGVARIRMDGGTGIISVDPLFTMWTDSTDAFHSMAVSADAVYLGGRIRSVKGQAYAGIARVDRLTGDRDELFRAETPDDVLALRLWPDGTLYAGGALGTINLQAVGSVVRLDGTSGFVVATTGSRTDQAMVRDFADWESGYLQVAGQFTRLDNCASSGHGIVSVFPGNLVGIPGQQVLTRGNVRAHWRDPDGSLWVGGDFVQVEGVPMAGLARFDPSGQLDTSMSFDIRGGTGVGTIVRDGVGQTYVAGGFNWIALEDVRGVARFTPGGQLDFGLLLTKGPGFGPFIPARADDLVLHGGFAYVAGSFDAVRGMAGPIAQRNGLARVDITTGIVDPAWNPFSSVAGDQHVFRVLVDASRQRLLVGRSIAPQLLAVSLADGQAVADFVPGLNAGAVRAIARDPVADQLYVGGSGLSIPSPAGPIRDLFRLSAATGTPDTSWRPGLIRSSQVNDITVDDGSGIYVAGRMGLAVGAPDAGIAHFTRQPLESPWNPDFAPGLPRADRIGFDSADRTVTVSGGHLETALDLRIGIQRFPEALFPFSDGFE